VDKPWLKSYPPGMPAEANVTANPSLVHLMEEAFAKHATTTATVFMGRELSYRDLDRASAAFGAWLQAKGIARGARVAIMMPNLPQYFVAVCGILRAGCVVVNVNPMYTPRELEHQLGDSGAEAVVVLENFAATLSKALPATKVKQVVVASVGDMLGFPRGLLVNLAVRRLKKAVPPYSIAGAVPFNEALSEGSRGTLKPTAATLDDIAFLQYTGGTTGVAKGAILTHGNIVAEVLISEAWMGPTLTKGGPVEHFTMLCALPLYHIFSLVVCLWLGLRIGATNIIIADPRNLDALVAAVGKRRLNVLPGLNTLFNALLNHEGFRKLDFSELRICNGGGMATHRAVAEKWLELTGCPICEGYGLTETTAGATCNRVDTDRFTGTIGYPLPSVDIEIRDDAGKRVPNGEPGEICIKGPQVMTGYWQHPAETAKVMTADGFFCSGDIGIMDSEGLLRIVDRKKDMVLVSGFNVYPNEIEDVVATHPGVLECAVIGVPDEKAGEAVKLFVVLKDKALTEAALGEFCMKQLTGYKRPKYIVFRDSLPKSPVGKILRRELRDQPSA
jgi:long-chain acyl-CoA synthetase